MSSETTKATHTPGPWTLTETTREDRLGNKSPCWLVDGDPIYPEWVNPKDVHAEDYRTRVCEVFPPFYSEVAGYEKRISKSHQETRANARLIAAAPTMESALLAIVARIEGRYDDPSLAAYGPLTNTTNDIREIAKSALATL